MPKVYISMSYFFGSTIQGQNEITRSRPWSDLIKVMQTKPSGICASYNSSFYAILSTFVLCLFPVIREWCGFFVARFILQAERGLILWVACMYTDPSFFLRLQHPVLWIIKVGEALSVSSSTLPNIPKVLACLSDLYGFTDLLRACVLRCSCFCCLLGSAKASSSTLPGKSDFVNFSWNPLQFPSHHY